MTARHVGIADTSLRALIHLLPSSHVSVGRLLPIIDMLDASGFSSLDIWGDMPLEYCLGVLNENPWERLRTIASRATHTPLHMVLRGRCLLGSRPYGSRIVSDFVKQCVDCGVQRFVVYDALNDVDNLRMVSDAVRASGAWLCLTLVHAPSADDPRGSFGTVLDVAGQIAELGPDAMRLKTVAALGPESGPRIIKELRSIVSVPIEVDLDNTGGLAGVTAALCAKAGAETICASAAPYWFDPGTAPIAQVLATLSDLKMMTPVSMPAAVGTTNAFASLFHHPAYLATACDSLAEAGLVELHQLPISLVRQVADRLRAQGALERLGEVMCEMLRVREEIGCPALASPLAEIVATQGVLNVLYGRRWCAISDEMKAYLRGAYGTPPREPAAEILALVQDYAQEENIADNLDSRQRPEDLRCCNGDEPTLSDDCFLELLAPGAASRFFERRDAARLFDPAMFGLQSVDNRLAWQDESQDFSPERVRELAALLETSSVEELTVEHQGTRLSLRKAVYSTGEANTPQNHATQKRQEELETTVASAGTGLHSVSGDSSRYPNTALGNEEHHAIVAPMVGTFYRSPAPEAPAYVEVGQFVEMGDVLCILEAMKLMNEVVAEVSGTITAIFPEDGAPVEYGERLFLIETGS